MVLQGGGYRPCSRNPLIAQTLATLGQMEQRGSGFARMHEAMLNHGLDVPKFDLQDGFFVVTLPGPAGNYDRLKVPEGATGPITPAVETQLNGRQREMVKLLVAGEELVGGACETRFRVTRPVITKDFNRLVELGTRSCRRRCTGQPRRNGVFDGHSPSPSVPAPTPSCAVASKRRCSPVSAGSNRRNWKPTGARAGWSMNT